MITLTKKNTTAILKHAAEAAPQECCGLLIAEGRAQVYLPCKNVAGNPAEAFEIDAGDWVAAESRGEILAVVHSHPQGEPCLSNDDRHIQVAHGLPWLLAVNGEVRQFRPLLRLRGRVFEYGKADCSVLLVDAYHLAGIELADYARADMDADADNLLAHGMGVGFVQVHDDMQPGDVVVTTHRGKPSHVALYIGNNELLHHAYDQLSRREPYGEYWRNQTHSVWRHPQWQPEMLQAIMNDLE